MGQTIKIFVIEQDLNKYLKSAKCTIKFGEQKIDYDIIAEKDPNIRSF